MAFYKPQSPITKGDDYIYPLTTIDQIILDDDTRLNAKCVTADLLDAPEDTTPTLTNSDLLGGVPAKDYALKQNLQYYQGSTIYTHKVQLPVANWVQGEELYTQTVEVEGITIDVNKTNLIVGPPTDRAMEEEYLGCAVRAQEQGDGIVVFSCTDLPTIDLEANVMVITITIGGE